MIKCCATCHYWGPTTTGMKVADIDANQVKLGRRYVWVDYQAFAECAPRMRGQEYGQHYVCGHWSQRSGEPLGSGLSWLWFCDQSWLEPASIIHDLRYEDQAGMSWADIDSEWLSNALLLAGNNWRRKAVAYVGYLVIRAYSLVR